MTKSKKPKGCVLASIPNVSNINGSGLRLVIWFQGCNHNCKNCHAPHTHDINKGMFFSNEYIIGLIRHNIDFMDGISISGGDPLLQPANLSQLLSDIKKEFPTLNIWLWTGYSFKYAEQHFPYILNKLDTLIDGTYIDELKTKHPHKGSSNQNVWNKKENTWGKENE